MIHWYKCVNRDCKNYNREFSMAVEDVHNKPSQCPFCHRSSTLSRLVQLEWKNKHFMAENLVDKKKRSD